MSERQPIETAPRDGTVIKVWTAGGLTFRVSWQGGYIDTSGNGCDVWVAEDLGDHSDCWTDGVCWAENAAWPEKRLPDSLGTPIRTTGDAAMTTIRRILAIFRATFSRAKPQPTPAEFLNPKPWSRLGRRLVSIHISDASRK